MVKRLALVAIAVTVSVGQGAIPRHLPVADEAVQDPALKLVRDQLLDAARSGDVERVWRYVSPDIQATYANERGLKELKRKWNVDASPVRFLAELQDVLSLGGRFEAASHESFVAPSLWVDFPDPLLAGQYIVVVRKNSKVHARPDNASSVIDRVNDNVLPYVLAFEGYVAGWIKVTLPDKGDGYMHESDLRNVSGTRAYFTRSNGKWLLTGFYDGVD